MSHHRKNPVRLALVQDADQGSVEANLEQAKRSIQAASDQKAHIVCLKELCFSSYFCTTEDHDFFSLAVAHDDPLFDELAQLARSLEIVLIVPFFERRMAGVYHNSAIVIDADGSTAGMYRKMHIPDDPMFYEKFYFTPGDATGVRGPLATNGEGQRDRVGSRQRCSFPAFQTRYGRISVLICWDQWYPEAARIATLNGAEVIFYPTAIGWHPSEKDEFGVQQRGAWQTVQRGHAVANGVYVAATNRVGFEPTPGTDGLEFFGSSFVAGPMGDLIAEAKLEPTILFADVDLAHLETVRQHWPFLRDRRIDAYGDILKRVVEH